MIITVFGTGSPSEKGYQEGYELGKTIALAGHTLKNGGYGGIMKASAQGATDAGGEAIGVRINPEKVAWTCLENNFLTKIIIKDTLHERIEELMNADYVVVLEGKLGTLEEIFVAWNVFFANGKGKLYLVGEKNKKLFDFLMKNDFLTEEYPPFREVVDSINDFVFLNLLKIIS